MAIGRKMRNWGLAVLALAGCGQSTVQFVVVRPAVINVRDHGGSVSVLGFLPGQADYAEVAGQLKAEVIDHIANDVPGAVALREFGGGVVVSGRVDDYGLSLAEGRRADKCSDTVKEGEGDAAVTKKVEVDCVQRWYDWIAHMAVAVQVTAATGQILLLRPFVSETTGRGAESRDVAPVPPNGHPLLQALRSQIAAGIANLVAPHKEQVSAVLYDCVAPAKDTCAAGVRLFAESRYDPAVEAFTQAIGLLSQAKADKADLAKAHWNRAIVFQYSRRFDEALRDLAKANDLDASDSYTRQQREVERERALHLKLVEQGMAPIGPAAVPPPAAPVPAGSRP